MNLNYKFKTYVSDDLAFLALERPMMGGDFSEERNFSSVTTYEFPSTLALHPVFKSQGLALLCFYLPPNRKPAPFQPLMFISTDFLSPQISISTATMPFQASTIILLPSLKYQVHTTALKAQKAKRNSGTGKINKVRKVFGNLV